MSMMWSAALQLVKRSSSSSALGGRASVLTCRSLSSSSSSDTAPLGVTSVPSVKMLIDGNFVESQAKEFVPLTNPATQEVIGHVPLCTPQEFENAVQSSKEAFKTWR